MEPAIFKIQNVRPIHISTQTRREGLAHHLNLIYHHLQHGRCPSPRPLLAQGMAILAARKSSTLPQNLLAEVPMCSFGFERLSSPQIEVWIQFKANEAVGLGPNATRPTRRPQCRLCHKLHIV